MLGQLGRTRIHGTECAAYASGFGFADQFFIHATAAVVDDHMGASALQAGHHGVELRITDIGFEGQVRHQLHAQLLAQQLDVGQVLQPRF